MQQKQEKTKKQPSGAYAGARDDPGLAGGAGSCNSPAPWPSNTALEGPDRPGAQGSLQRPIKGTLTTFKLEKQKPFLSDFASLRLSELLPMAIKQHCNALLVQKYPFLPRNEINMQKHAPWSVLQASQAAAAKLLSPVLGCLTAHYPQDQFAPASSPPSAPTPPAQGVQVEEWLGSKAVGGQTAQQRPQWHHPTPPEMQFAEELVQTFMMGACQQLQQIGGSSLQGGKYQKEQIQGLLLQIEGSVHGLRSALADFVPPPETQQGSGQGLSLIGAAAPLVGGSGARDTVAKSLIAAAGFIGANDYETLGILLRVMSGVLSRGAHEFQEANDSFGSWKNDQDVAFDPPIAALLFDQVH